MSEICLLNLKLLKDESRMSKQQNKMIIYCALAVVFNIILGSVATLIHIPFLYLDTIGTIFIAANFPLGYGLLTALCTHLVLAILYGPLALPFTLVSFTVAIITHLVGIKHFNYLTSLLLGIALAFFGALVSAPIRLILFEGFGGLDKSITDILVFSLQASGINQFFSAFWGAFTDSIVDKILSCFIVYWLYQFKNSQRCFH